MAILYQLDLFENKLQNEERAILERVTLFRESLDKVRKGTYARLNEQGKKIDDVSERLSLLERNLCREGV